VTKNQLLQAFTAEHRAGQRAASQLSSCREATDITNPLIDRDLFRQTTIIPLGMKLHNRISQQLIARNAPHLLEEPLGATLTPARAPLLAQELSRGVRKMLEATQWRMHRATRGVLAPPRFSWANFEFLRDRRVLSSLAEDLRADWWDRKEIERLLAAMAMGERKGSVHPVGHQFMKIYTLDLLLRS
jgi:hypothetical protein